VGSSPTTRANPQKMESLKVWFKDVLDEMLYKVQWPSLEDLQSSTVTVLIASIIIALIIFVMDFVFNQGMGFLYSLFNG
jgi:preprotein translocase subunit SecE